MLASATIAFSNYVMPPRNLCNNLLHKFLIGVSFGEFSHILEIAHGIALGIRIFQAQVTG